MENHARIAMEASRRIVQEGLARRRLESKLEAFEDEMIHRINENHDEAIWNNECDRAIQNNRELCEARIHARAEAAAAARQKRKDTALGCMTFFIYAVVMYWFTTCTYFPVWAAATFIVGGILILAAYLCRVHGLLSMEDKK